MPQTAPIRRRLPTTPKRRKQTGGRPGRTLGDGSRVQRGQLKPRTLTLRTSHFPDLPTGTIQLKDTTPLDTERRRLGDRSYNPSECKNLYRGRVSFQLMASPVGERGRPRYQGINSLLGEQDGVAGGLGQLLDARRHVHRIADQRELQLAATT